MRKSSPKSAAKQCEQFLKVNLPQMQFLTAEQLMMLKPNSMHRRLIFEHRQGSSDVAAAWLRTALRIEEYYIKRYPKAAPAELRDCLEADHALGHWGPEQIERLDAAAGHGFTAEELRSSRVPARLAQHFRMGRRGSASGAQASMPGAQASAPGAEGPEESGPGAEGAGSGPEEASAPEVWDEEADFGFPEDDAAGKDNVEKQSIGDEQSVEQQVQAAMANYGWAASSWQNRGGKGSQGGKGGKGGRGKHETREAPHLPQLQGRQKKRQPRGWQSQQKSRSRSRSRRQDHQQSRSCHQHSGSRCQQSRSQRQQSRSPPRGSRSRRQQSRSPPRGSRSRRQQSRSPSRRSRSQGRSQIPHGGQKRSQSRSSAATLSWLQGADVPASPDAQGESSASRVPAPPQVPPPRHLLPQHQTSQVPKATAGETPQEAGAVQPSQSAEGPGQDHVAGRRVLVRMPSDAWMAMSGTDAFKPYLGKPVSFHREGDMLFAVIHDDAPEELLPADPGAEMPRQVAPRGSAASASPGAQGASTPMAAKVKQRPEAAKPAHIFGPPTEPPGKPKRQQQPGAAQV